MARLTVPPGVPVVTQGDVAGDAFYVVQTGRLQVELDGVVVAHRGPGDAFGELALLYACPRNATVRVVTDGPPAQLWVLQQRWYRVVSRSAHALRTAAKARHACALM